MEPTIKPDETAVRCTSVVGDESNLRAKSGAGGGAEPARYYAHEFARGRWHVCDRQCYSTPLYDDARYGNDKPLVFDEDSAFECVERLNSEAVAVGEEDDRSDEGSSPTVPALAQSGGEKTPTKESNL